MVDDLLLADALKEIVDGLVDLELRVKKLEDKIEGNKWNYQ